MSEKNEKEIIFEDIESTSKKGKLKKARAAVKSYENGSLRHIDKVIKAISFIVAIGIFLIFTAIAALLVMLDQIFASIAVAVFIVGIVLALITLFIIFGIGHIISLNKEILRRL